MSGLKRQLDGAPLRHASDVTLQMVEGRRVNQGD